MTSLEIAEWLTAAPRFALTAAAGQARQVIPGRLGDCVAEVLLDHLADVHPDPNIHELAHVLLQDLLQDYMPEEDHS